MTEPKIKHVCPVNDVLLRIEIAERDFQTHKEVMEREMQSLKEAIRSHRHADDKVYCEVQ